jgi:hypothetical protein
LAENLLFEIFDAKKPLKILLAKYKKYGLNYPSTDRRDALVFRSGGRPFFGRTISVIRKF